MNIYKNTKKLILKSLYTNFNNLNEGLELCLKNVPNGLVYLLTDGVPNHEPSRGYMGSLERFIDRNKSALYFAIASHISLANAKNFLISKLAQVQSIGHFLRTPNGYKVTAPEGYVAVDRVAGAIKLVDRLEFSRANFTIAKDWVKG